MGGHIKIDCRACLTPSPDFRKALLASTSTLDKTGS